MVEAQLANDVGSRLQVLVNAFKLGWKPKWNQGMFLKSMDDEVAAVLEPDTIKATTVFDVLK